MKLSKYFRTIELDNKIFAIFNTLIMDILYVNKEKLNDIVNNSNLSEEEIKKLKEQGIYIESDSQDEEAFNAVKNRYDEIVGKIHVMYLILSSSCNLACRYCFIENCSFNNNKEISMQKLTAETAVNKYADYLIENKLELGQIVLYGGEPLINWEAIVTAIECAKSKPCKIQFSMVTNATLLDVEKMKYLADNNVEIGISIDGPKDLNDKNRIYRNDIQSVYDQVVSKFPQLNTYKCKYGISVTVSEDLLDKQDEVLEWFKELGISSIFYNLYHFSSYSDTWESYYERASQFLLKSYDILSKNNIYDGRLKRKLDSLIDSEFKFSDCAAIGGNQITIKPNGDVCVCHGYFKTDKYIIGNINLNSIEELVNSDEINFWKLRGTLNNSECQNCESLFICGGGCPFQAEALFKNRNEIDKPFCIHTKSALKWVLQNAYNYMIEEK